MASSITTLSSATTIPLAFMATRSPTKNPSRSHRISCKSTDNNQESSSSSSRRNLLVGLGGLYGANTLSTVPFSFAGPIEPDSSKCSPAHIIPDTKVTRDCCPPPHKKFIDFKLPEPPTTMRFRLAAHLADGAYLDKFKKAMELMRALPDNDPRSFKQQANVHCAYCDGAYDQVGFPHQDIDVHYSWLFFPFHRCYLYFFERILGKLIDDPNFAMPYWNWDSPDGMRFPTMYTDPESPLYDPLRDALHTLHWPRAVVDLSYNGCDNNVSPLYQINTNLFTMHRQMVWNSKTARAFFGNPYRLGDPYNPRPGAGSIEHIPHNTVHNWTGDRKKPNGEDMGIFYSAARDPVFYAHHSNVDRMWTLWKTLPGGRRQEFTDPDFLDAAFFFYDENKQMVRIKVRDCLDNTKLGYEYQNVDIPWENKKPRPRVSPDRRKKLGREKAAPTDTLPAKLDRVLKIMVKRPKKNRSRKEKEEMEEILVIQGIELEEQAGYVKFDVYINDIEDDDEITTPENTEFAGSFVSVPHRHRTGEKINTQLRLSITDILEELGTEDDDNVMVTLFPTAGDVVMIHGIEIELGD